MTSSSAKLLTNPQGSQWWRVALSVFCIVVAIVALTVTVAAQYVRDNALTTERYVEIVTPLPKQGPVANALADYTTTALFNAVDTEKALKDFLPQKLDPLAAPLATTLRQKTTEVARDFIQSDNFTTIWVEANRLLHQNFMQIADKELAKEHPTNINKATDAVANLDLDGLITELEKRFGSDATIVSTAQQVRDLQVNLQQDIEQLQTTVSFIKTTAFVMPYVFLAFILAAIAAAYNRRHAAVAIGITLVLLGAAMIIGFKTGSQNFMGNIDNASYRAAAQVVYEAFYSDLRLRITYMMWAGGIITILAILAGPYAWATWLRKLCRIPELQHSVVWTWAQIIRKYTRAWFWWIAGLGFAIILTVLLARSTVTPANLVVASAVLLAYLALLIIIGWSSPSRRRIAPIRVVHHRHTMPVPQKKVVKSTSATHKSQVVVHPKAAKPIAVKHVSHPKPKASTPVVKKLTKKKKQI